MIGERRIPAPRRIVWDALNDPEVLKASIPGCQSLEKTSDTQMKATAAVKIGPISARFTGNVQLTDLDPPNGYSIGGEGQGGVAGFAKGGAKVALEDDGADTTLRYEVHAQVGGKIAQLGARLVDATAKQMADQFFDRFSAQVTAMVPAAGTVGEPAAMPLAEPAAIPHPASMPPPDHIRAFPSAPGEVVAHPVLPPAYPPPSVSLFALIPPEPFGLPMAAWIGGAAYLLILLLFFGSLI
jgi:carbon monoxide dehydrogenase subunit G